MILRLGENGTTAPRPGVGLVWLKRTGRALAGNARTARHELRGEARRGEQALASRTAALSCLNRQSLGVTTRGIDSVDQHQTCAGRQSADSPPQTSSRGGRQPGVAKPGANGLLEASRALQ